jgi:6-phosphogluconolactonase (cycloisomerase 2 family)
MKHRTILGALLAALAVALVGVQSSLADPGDGHGKVVFVQTNELNGNRILVYDRGQGGQLTPAGSYATGGNGGAAAPGTESDRLASQGSLAYAPAHQTLIALNAGSDTVSAFRVQGDTLTLLNVVASGGQFPNSVSVHDGIAYVLNAGGAGTVQGFRIGEDGLAPIPGSARSLGLANSDPPNFLSAPGQVGFTPDGRWLLVTTKASTSSVEVFRVQGDLLSATPVVTPSATPVPFAFTFGPGGRLVDGEAGTSSVTTYEIENDGTLTDPQSQSDGQVALCWIDRVHDVYFVSNTGSNTVSSFRVGPDGRPELLAAVAATTNPGTIDLVSSGQFLYVETGLAGTVDEFAANDDGILTSIGSVTGLPPGIEGIAAK